MSFLIVSFSPDEFVLYDPKSLNIYWHWFLLTILPRKSTEHQYGCISINDLNWALQWMHETFPSKAPSSTCKVNKAQVKNNERGSRKRKTGEKIFALLGPVLMKAGVELHKSQVCVKSLVPRWPKHYENKVYGFSGSPIICARLVWFFFFAQHN